jgi:hypothetical protein
MPEIIDNSVAVRSLSPTVLEQYYRTLDWPCPRFYQSPTVLAGGGAQYRAAFIEDCLVILKWKRFYAQKVAYAILPPMSRTGDVGDERRAVRTLIESGFHVMLVSHDAARYDIPLDDLEPVPWNTEYIYLARDLAELKGKDWAHLRVVRNRAEREGYRCIAGPPQPGETGDVLRLTRDWVKYRGKGGSMMGYVRSLGWWPKTTLFKLYPDAGNDLAAFSYTEEVGAGSIITGRLRDYAITAIHDPMQLIAHHEAMWEVEHRGPDRLMNLGAADPVGGPGLRHHKLALHPVATQQVYRLRAIGPLDETSTEPKQLEFVL